MKLVVAFAVLVVACAVAPAKSDRSAIIVRDIRNNALGSYQFDFATSNGIQREENGEQQELPDNNYRTVVRGTASWTSPEGTPIELKYTADENGYHPIV